MKRNRTFLTAALLMTAALSCTAYAQEKTVNMQIGNAQMTVNGVVSELDSPPVIIDSRTLVPIRAIVEALDGEVDWDNATKTATLSNSKGDVVKLTINSRTASYNGIESELDTAPVIINERTMLPIRFVAESFGYKTDWNAADKSITISNGGEASKTVFDLNGLEEMHIASDAAGNTYSKLFNDDMSDNYLVIKDKNATTAVYKVTAVWGNVYKSDSGSEAVFIYDPDTQEYSVLLDGKEIKTEMNDEYYPADKDGNVYHQVTEDEKLVVTDKSGNVISTYSDTGEMRNFVVDENGNRACMVSRRNGGYKDGFISPDGKYTEFELNFDDAYMGSDGKIYCSVYDYIIVTDKNHNIIDELKTVPDSVDDIYSGEDGTEYIVTGDFAESYTFKSADKTITLTCDPEEEHNKKLFAKGEYGSEDKIYYSGDDGKVYVAKDFVYTVYGKDGKAEDKITMQRYEEKYKSSKGKTYIWTYVYSEEKPYIKADGETVKLDAIISGDSAEETQELDYLVYVTKNTKLPDYWEDTVELVHVKNSLGDDVAVEKKAYDAYLELKSDLEKDGIYVDLDSAFRSIAEQQAIVDDFTVTYGEDYVKQYVAVPGFSEHHTGLALDLYLNIDGKDVYLNEDMVEYPEIWAKIHEKLADHGFILRYLDGKEEITGYSYEPWHIRYVDSVDIAKEITEKGETFEEYLGKPEVGLSK